MKRFWLISINIFSGLVCLLVITLLYSCSETGKQNSSAQIESYKLDSIRKKPGSSFSDTITIDYPAAIFFNPDKLQLEKIKAVTDTMIFESMTHDCFYQMKNTRNTIKKNWPGIKILEVRDARYLELKSSDGSREWLDLDAYNDACGIFLFDRQKKARLVDMTNIDTELDFYFNK